MTLQKFRGCAMTIACGWVSALSCLAGDGRIGIYQADVPFTITNSGSYFAGENLQSSSGSYAIRVAANHVTLDLAGRSVAGGATAWEGIYQDAAWRNLTVCNGNVYRGVHAYGKFSRIESVTVSGALQDGIATGPRGSVRDCTVVSNTPTVPSPAMIRVGTMSAVENCAVSLSSSAADLTGIYADDYARIGSCEIVYCVAAGTLVGIRAGRAALIEDSAVEHCGASGSTTLHAIQAGAGAIVSGCRLLGNVTAGSGSVMVRSSAYGSSPYNYNTDIGDASVIADSFFNQGGQSVVNIRSGSLFENNGIAALESPYACQLQANNGSLIAGSVLALGENGKLAATYDCYILGNQFNGTPVDLGSGYSRLDRNMLISTGTCVNASGPHNLIIRNSFSSGSTQWIANASDDSVGVVITQSVIGSASPWGNVSLRP